MRRCAIAQIQPRNIPQIVRRQGKVTVRAGEACLQQFLDPVGTRK